MIGIIGAMDVELDMLKSALTDIQEKNISNIDFVSGKLSGKEVVIAKCGIGKVFAAICAQTMILEYAPEYIINTGVAGALRSGISVGDVVVSLNAVQHDMDTSALGDPKGLVSGINVINFPADKKLVSTMQMAVEEQGIKAFVGNVASGDKFVHEAEEKTRIAEEFDAFACEMEGAAIAHVCFVNKTPFVVVRAISDSIDGGAADYMTFVKSAAKTSANTVISAIEKL